MAGFAHITPDLSLESAAEERFRLAVEACPNGMVMSDSAGTIVLANTETERLFGYRQDELIGQSIEILLPERLRGGHRQHRASFASRPEMRRLGKGRNLLGCRRDGTEFPIEIGLFPIRNGEGPLVLSVIIDLSDRKRMDRLKDEFVSTVSHELRTPLTSIAGSLGLLIGGAAGVLPEPAVRLIRIAQSNSQRLVRLINDILDIEKIESGETAFKFRRLGARALVEQVIEANRGYADSFRVQIRLDADPPTGEVYADADRLAQVITNLLSNAIKFSPPGGEVAVAIHEQDDTVRIAVRDYGHGIPSEFRPQLFEKFAQADATDARQKGGTGLGLSIVKQIVTRLGGTVGFEDAAGGGTVFHVTLPGWAQIAAREIDAQRSVGAGRVLLCEDDLNTAVAVRNGLRAIGFSTDFAHSAPDAITRAGATVYDAVLIDLDLPDGNGIGLVRTLRECVREIPIMIICDDDCWDKDASRDVLDLNILECIQKPVNVDLLVKIIERVTWRGADGRARILHVDHDRGAA